MEVRRSLLEFASARFCPRVLRSPLTDRAPTRLARDGYYVLGGGYYAFGGGYYVLGVRYYAFGGSYFALRDGYYTLRGGYYAFRSGYYPRWCDIV